MTDTNPMGPISPPTCRDPILSQSKTLYVLAQSICTSPPRLPPEGIELETLRKAHFKIPSQPLGQPQMKY